jgi:arylsulfatase A-like enzyme
METVDDEFQSAAFKWVDKAHQDGKPFFLWLNPTRMHAFTHLSPKYEAMRTPENGWSMEEAGMAQLDDIVGATMQKLKDMGVDDNTIVVFTTDNGTENFTWPDGGQTPFAGGKGTALEGGFRVPAIVRWPGKIPAGKVENGIFSGLDWFPTFVAAAGDSNVAAELQKGKQIGDTNYKVYIDGYNQLDLLTGKGPSASTRPEPPGDHCHRRRRWRLASLERRSYRPLAKLERLNCLLEVHLVLKFRHRGLGGESLLSFSLPMWCRSLRLGASVCSALCIP